MKYSESRKSMSMRPQSIPDVPEETVEVARKAFPKGKSVAILNFKGYGKKAALQGGLV